MRISRLFLTALALVACKPKDPEPIPPPPPAVVNSFTASPAVVAKAGDLVTLSWDTKDATHIALERVGKGPVAIDATAGAGMVQVAVEGDSTFVLTAIGEGGTDSSVQSVTLGSSGAGFVFEARPRSVRSGESVTLVWNVPGASAVTVKPQGGAALDLHGHGASGSIAVVPAADARYQLESGGLVLGSVDVSVTPEIVSFTAAPSVPSGQPVTLFWNVAGGGTRLTLTRVGAAAPLLVETTPASIARGSFTDTPPRGPVDGIFVYRLELEAHGMSQTAELTVRIGGSLVINAFSVPTYARSGVQYTVSWRTQGASYLEVQLDDVTVFVAASQAMVDVGAATLPAISSGSRRLKLVIRNDRGGEVVSEKTVTAVDVPVFVSFTADKSSIAAGGEPVVLSWNVTNARDIRIVQEGAGIIHTVTGNIDTGTFTVYPNRSSVTYTLFASNGAGQSVPPSTVTVTVGSIARLTFRGPAPVGSSGVVTGHTVLGGTEVYGLPVVTKNRAGEQFIDITGSTELFTSNTDSAANLNAIGETFTARIYGRLYSYQSVLVSPNGWFWIGDGYFDGPNTNQLIGTSLLEGTLAPYFRDLKLITGVSHIWGRVDTVGNERRLIVQFTDLEDKASPGSRLTFQGQVWSGGKVVFAYQKFQGVAVVNGDIGVVSGTRARTLQAGSVPGAGDTFTFFGPAALPFTMPVENAPYLARVAVGTGFIDVEGDERYWLQITEANPRPAVGIVNGEWLEVQNTTGTAIDLNGYTLSFGGTNTHVINNTVIVPPNGRIVLAQAQNLGDPTAMVNAAYLYPSTLTMPDTTGSVSLMINGTAYSTLSWTSASATAAGVSVRADTQVPEGAYAGSIVCSGAGSGTYGLQTGTPGAAQGRCFPYVLSRIAGAFEPIALNTMATPITFSSTNDAVTAVATPIMYYGASVPTIYVSTNGWISTTSTTSSIPTTKLAPSTSNPVGSIAPWWEDFAYTTGAGAGVYRLSKDPDGTPANGDEYTLISWENFHLNATAFVAHNMNFQVKFFANGNIEYHYGPQATPGRDFGTGSFGLSWLEDRTGRGALVGNAYDTIPGISERVAFRYTYTP